MPTIQEQEDKITADLSLFEDELEKYEYIIEQGRNLKPLSEIFRTDENLVMGCQSKVWVGHYKENDLLFLEADSNTEITKGIVALLIQVLSGQKPSDILHADLDFIAKTNLRSHLSSQRSNGLSSMILRIQNIARHNL